MKNVDILPRFLKSPEACILCRYQTNCDVDEPSWTSRYVIPQHHAATFRFFEYRPEMEISYDLLRLRPGTFIPATHMLTLIVPRGTNADLASAAQVPWKLFGYEDLRDWFPCSETDPLESVHRNRYP
jgi:hypothetical protein